MEKRITKLVNKFLKESFVDITDMDVNDAVEAVETVSENEDYSDMFMSIDDEHGWYDRQDKKYDGDFDFEYDEEEIDSYDDLMSKYGDRQKWFAPERSDNREFGMTSDGRRMFDMYKDKYQKPFRLRKRRPMGENEMEEGNAFSGALAKAKEEGKDSFEVDGKTYKVQKEEINNKIKTIIERRQKKLDEKWKGNVEVEKTGEYADMSIEEINSAIKKLKEKHEKAKEDGKKVSEKDKSKMSQLYFAKRAKQDWPGKGKSKVKESTVLFTESELIDFIERIVEAETKEDKITMKNLKSSKEVNDKALSDTNKKMKDYMKDMGMSYEAESEGFPKGNSVMSREGKDGKEITDDVKKAYKASKEIEEYIDNFTAAGLENLDYDNIKPNEDWVTDNIEGSSRTGNSPEYANAVKTDVNKKINQKRKENLLAVLKRQAYNKAAQPVHSDEAGESVPSSLSGNKNSKVNRILAAESVENKKVNQDIETMKNLINYNKKTQ